MNAPYNYVFSDVIPETLSGLIKEILDGDVAITPTFGQAELDIVTAGLLATLTADIWGWAKDLLLYVKPSTLRVTANGYAVLTNRVKHPASHLRLHYLSTRARWLPIRRRVTTQ